MQATVQACPPQRCPQSKNQEAPRTAAQAAVWSSLEYNGIPRLRQSRPLRLAPLQLEDGFLTLRRAASSFCACQKAPRLRLSSQSVSLSNI